MALAGRSLFNAATGKAIGRSHEESGCNVACCSSGAMCFRTCWSARLISLDRQLGGGRFPFADTAAGTTQECDDHVRRYGGWDVDNACRHRRRRGSREPCCRNLHARWQANTRHGQRRGRHQFRGNACTECPGVVAWQRRNPGIDARLCCRCGWQNHDRDRRIFLGPWPACSTDANELLYSYSLAAGSADPTEDGSAGFDWDSAQHLVQVELFAPAGLRRHALSADTQSTLGRVLHAPLVASPQTA